MQVSSIKLYSLNYSNVKTYIIAALFVAGNILLPQLCHLMPQGGMVWLPIYFFTLVGAYKYGWKVGLLTALLSPLCNHLMFGMPAAAVLVPIFAKSVVLALAAAFVAKRSQNLSLLLMVAVVFAGAGLFVLALVLDHFGFQHQLGLVGNGAQAGGFVFTIAKRVTQGGIGHSGDDGVGIRISVTGNVNRIHKCPPLQWLGYM